MLAPDAGGRGVRCVCVCVCWAVEAQELRFLVDGGLAEKGEKEKVWVLEPLEPRTPEER